MSDKPLVDYKLADLGAYFESGTKARIAHESAVSKSPAQRNARPRRKTTNLTVRIAPKDKMSIADLAKRLDMSISDLVVECLKQRARDEGYQWRE